MTLTFTRTLADTIPADAFAAAYERVTATDYVIADAHTHAPITPYAPIRGALGIRADVARTMPGMTALPASDVAPERRLAFADTLARMAETELRVWEHYESRLSDPGLSDTSRANLTARMNRAAEESDRCSDRAFRIRQAA